MSAKAYYHLPGLFEFYEFYRAFLPLYRANRDWFYDWCEIGSIYGAPADCLWGGGRAGFGECGARDALALAQEYGVSARLTFSNSLLREEHLSDRKCNALCELFSQANGVQNGVIVHSELLTDYLKDLGIELIDFKLEFGITNDGQLVLADEISPDTCRFWDTRTGEKLDKDRFRRDLGNVEDAYIEIRKRLMGE